MPADGSRPAFLPVSPGANITTLAQAWIDAGREVHLPPGTYFGNLVVDSGSVIAGSGEGATTLRAPNGSSSDVITSRDFGTLTGGGTGGGPREFRIRDITIDGNKAHTSAGWCMRVYGRAYRVTDVTFTDGNDGGVWSEWGPGGSEMEAKWVNWRCLDSAGPGLVWRGPHDSLFVNGIVAGQDGHDAVVTDGFATSEQFTNVHLWGFHSNGFVLRRTAYMANCQSEGATGANVLFAAGGSSWVGGTVFGTQGTNGSANETGFQWGTGTEGTIGGTQVVGARVYNFPSGGRPLRLVNATAGTVCEVALFASSVTTAIHGTPSTTDIFQVTSNDSTARSAESIWQQRGRFLHYPASGATSSFVFKDATGASDLMNFNPTSGRLEFPNGTDLRLFTGNYSGQTVELNAAGHLDMAEVAAPSAPAADTGRLFVRDNGSGKTQLCVRFPTGAIQVIATEP